MTFVHQVVINQLGDQVGYDDQEWNETLNMTDFCGFSRFSDRPPGFQNKRSCNTLKYNNIIHKCLLHFNSSSVYYYLINILINVCHLCVLGQNHWNFRIRHMNPDLRPLTHTGGS